MPDILINVCQTHDGKGLSGLQPAKNIYIDKHADRNYTKTTAAGNQEYLLSYVRWAVCARAPWWGAKTTLS